VGVPENLNFLIVLCVLQISVGIFERISEVHDFNRGTLLF